MSNSSPPDPDQEVGIESELRSDGVLLLTLNRPEVLNPFSVEVRETFNSLLGAVQRGELQCRAVVLTGTGRAFSAGGDVSEMPDFFGQGPDVAVRHMDRFQEMCRLAWRLPVPLIAAVNGLALGGGTAIALMCDLRVVSEDAQFGVGQVRRGVVPDVGLTYILPRTIGLARALEMMLLDRRIDAATALTMGLVNRVVPAADVLSSALELAQEIAALPEPAVRWIKRATLMNLDNSFDQALNLEAMAEGLLTSTPEFRAGLDAFLSRR
jgi:2-(1,2-epoxy-1,2-dihydrophenyl)acetyl-CoA isomerase